MGTIATIGGKTIIGAFAWSLRSGTAPVTGVARVTNEDAAALLDGDPKPVDLVISSDVGGKATFSGLYVLQKVPADSPEDGTHILIADRRWLWPSAVFKKSYNITRRVGTKRLVSPNQIIENQQLAAAVVYAPWSMIDGTKAWDAKTVIESLADAIKDVEIEYNGKSPLVSTAAASAKNATPVQDLELDGQLDECIERALAYLPGLAVRVNADGNVYFFDTSDNTEGQSVHGAEIVGMGHVQPIQFARVRPSKIRFLFTLNAELRFNFSEGETTFDADARYMENVAPVPDPVFPEGAVGAAAQVTGTWIPLETLYSGWGTVPGLSAPITTRFVRAAMVPFIDLWATVADAGKITPTADWASRAATVMTHFRQTFRINRRWMDRIAELRANRVGTLDPITGTLGKAPVYSDYAYVYSQRSLYLESNGGDGSFVVNVAAYPSGGTIDENTRAAAATLSVVDAEQGILSIDYLADKFRVYEQALPSQVEQDGDGTVPGTQATNPGPNPNLGFSTRGIGFNVIGVGDAIPMLTANHKVAVIVSCVPASPNDKSSLIAVEVSPTDADVPYFNGANDCRGPVMEVRVNPAMECARVAWTDAAEQEIHSFFTRPAGVAPLNAANISDLILNYSGSAKGGASIKGIAVAGASAIWTSFRDRQVGTMVTGYTPQSFPRGALSSVSHSIDGATGAVTTQFTLPDRVAPLDISRYLPASIKRFLFKIASPGQ